MRRSKKSSGVDGVDRVSAAPTLSIETWIYRRGKSLGMMMSWTSIGRGHFEQSGVSSERE